MRPLTRFGPPLAWMGVIALLSGDPFGAERTGAWLLPLLGHLLPGADPAVLHVLHAALRKLAHVMEYGILAALWLGTFRPAPRAAVWAVALAAGYAGLDEIRQGFTPTRGPSALDVLLDAAGALVAVACLEGSGPVAALVLRLARWTAVAVALGSLAAAGLDWSLGLDARDLALAAAGAGAAAWALWRRGRRSTRRGQGD